MTKHSRGAQAGLFLALAVGSWLAMQAVHELGHVVGAWATGGRVTRVVLHPLTISRTDVAPNPRPLLVVWAGPLCGALAPLFPWLVSLKLAPRIAPLLRFFAGFCLVANGLYLGFGSFDRVGDCGDLLRHGAQVWQLWLFGAVTVPCGFWLWNGQGKHFGLGEAEGRVDPVLLVAAVSLAGVAVLIGLIVGGK